MKRRNLFGIALAAALMTASIIASDWRLPVDEPKLKSAPGFELVAANCQICHSADYISTQPPLSRPAWTATVQKMREKYGAPLPPDRVEAIVDYLAANYGKK